MDNTCIRAIPCLCAGSLAVSLKEEKLGKWYNFETGEYGDMLGKKYGAPCSINNFRKRKAYITKHIEAYRMAKKID